MWLGVASAPFISTLDPALVIDDPAVMYVMGAILTVLGCEMADRRLTERLTERPAQSKPKPDQVIGAFETPPVRPRPVRR